MNKIRAAKRYGRLFIFLVAIFVIFSTLTACGPKRLPPGEPTIDPPTEPSPPKPESPLPPEPPRPDTTEPPKPAKPPLEAPQMKPRQASKADPASTRLMEGGVKQLNAGNLEEAEQLFEQALRVSPTNGKPYYYLGVIAAQQKNFERSLGFLQRAENLLHTDNFWMSQVLLEEGVVLKSMNRKAEARQKFQEALQRDPTNQHAAKELKTLGK